MRANTALPVLEDEALLLGRGMGGKEKLDHRVEASTRTDCITEI